MLPGVSKLPDATLKASITSWLKSSTVELPVFTIGPIPTSRFATAHASVGCLANSGLLKRVVSPLRAGKMESVLF